MSVGNCRCFTGQVNRREVHWNVLPPSLGIASIIDVFRSGHCGRNEHFYDYPHLATSPCLAFIVIIYLDRLIKFAV